MFAIASLLDPASDQAVRSLWRRFEVNCGLSGLQGTPLPHFSWMGAESMHLEPVEERLSKTASQTKSFIVTTSGMGVFTGNEPVVYIALVKDEQLLRLHQRVWEQTRPYASALNLHYEPENWVPHITLTYQQFDAVSLGCTIAEAAFQEIRLHIRVDHLALIYQDGDQAGIRSRFPFQDQVRPGDL